MRLAARGARELDHGTEEVTVPAERNTLRRQARAVHVQAVARAAVLTALTLALRMLVELSR